MRWLESINSGGLPVKNLPASAGDTGDTGLIPGLGRSPGVGNGKPLSFSCLENFMDRGGGQAIVHGFTEPDMTEWAHTHISNHTSNKGLIPQIKNFCISWIKAWIKKVGRRTEQMFFQREHTYSQHIHENVLNITNHQGNANENQWFSPHIC